MLFSEAIKNFLKVSTYPDLAELYNSSMEVQILVAQGQGEIYKEGKSNSYTDHVQIWYPLRIPRHANTIPENNDHQINYDLAKHALGIGMTGWDFINKVSKFVCFDFDSISGHSDKHTNRLTESELLEVQENVKNIPWVHLRYSTSGSGLHLYVFVDNIHTDTHTEHSSLARSILTLMSQTVNYDFQSKVDALGSILFQWHKKMIGTRGLKLIKSHTELCSVPINWKDHVPVILGKRIKATPAFIEDNNIDTFSELCGSKARIRLDSDHKLHIKWLQDNGHTVTYNQDFHIFIIHTHALKLMHHELKLKGLFDTVATGSQPGDINGWMSPLSKGGWLIRRYSQGIIETPNWDQDVSGYTKCYLNKCPEFKIVARCFNGIEHPSGGWVFASAKEAQAAANILNINLGLPEWSTHKKCKLKLNKEGRLIAELDFDNNADIIKGGIPGYLQEGKNWKKIFDNTTTESEIESSSFDDLIRHMVSGASTSVGWSIKSYNNQWESNSLKHCEKVLASLGYKIQDINQILGTSILKSWRLVNKPFQPEYPGNREWNKNSAQLRFAPSTDKDNLIYPTWNMLLDHLGNGLNEGLSNNEWAKLNNIIKGSEYLKLWLASILQKPEEHLPYLFLYGPENCGKSTLQEAISLLISNGVQRADQALISQGSFNAEIEFAVVCAVEETDLRKNKIAASKIRDFVTSKRITIHRKNQTAYDSINITHWLQTSNDPKHCLSGNTEILTYEGIKTLKECAGTFQKLYVKTREGMKWISCEIKSFGIQKTYRVKFGNGYSVNATAYHQWITITGNTKNYKKICTAELDHNKRTYVPLAPQILTKYNEEYYAYGFVYGDGHRVVYDNKYIFSNVPLHNNDNDLKDLLLKFGTLGSQKINGERLNVIRQLSYNWKDLPNKNISKSQALGFILGLTCADGDVGQTCSIYQSNSTELEEIRKIALHAGIRTYNIREKTGEEGRYENGKPCYRMNYSTYNMNKELFLRKDYQEKFIRANGYIHTEVQFIDWNNPVEEEVYCAIVPEYHNFTLANNIITGNCPIFSGDTRITMIRVDSIDKNKMISKREMFKQLEKEAGDFIAELLNIEIPPCEERINIPVIITDEKIKAQQDSMSELELFIEDCCHYVEGELIKFSEFYDRFIEYLDPNSVHLYSKIRVGRELPERFPYGRSPQHASAFYIGNISWEKPTTNGVKKPKYIFKHDKLLLEVK